MFENISTNINYSQLIFTLYTYITFVLSLRKNAWIEYRRKQFIRVKVYYNAVGVRKQTIATRTFVLNLCLRRISWVVETIITKIFKCWRIFWSANIYFRTEGY
jgi:hypothetical protein